MRMKISKEFENKIDDCYSSGQLPKYCYDDLQKILKKVKLLEKLVRVIFKEKIGSKITENLAFNQERYFHKIYTELEEII